jgi:hypothetical protein
MKPGRPKELSTAARERMKLDSCEKCRHLTTKGGKAVCRFGKPLELCADFKDVSRASPRPEGGIVRLYQYPA